MIFVDSSAWIDHFRRASVELAALLAARVVLLHPFVTGELACGNLSGRDAVLAAMDRLPLAPVVPHAEAMAFVASHRLMERGVGWTDMHLLASATVAGRASLWSRDKRLMAAAAACGVAHARVVR